MRTLFKEKNGRPISKTFNAEETSFLLRKLKFKSVMKNEVKESVNDKIKTRTRAEVVNSLIVFILSLNSAEYFTMELLIQKVETTDKIIFIANA